MVNEKRKLSKLEILLEVLSIIGMICLFVSTIITYNIAPDIIPTHFNGAGVVDGYGSKGSVFIIPIIATILYATITLLTNYPQAYNYAVSITEGNREKQYKMATTFMRILKLELIGTFSYVELTTLNIINKGTGKMSIAFLPIMMFILFGSIGVYIYKSIKAK